MHEADPERAAAPRTGAAPDPRTDQAPRKKRETPTRKNTNVRNLVWAIGLNLIVAAVLAVIVVGLGDSSRDATAQRAESVDIAQSAERAADVLPFPVVAPLPDGWSARDARVSTQEPQSWTIRYTSPGSALVTLVQQGDASPALLSSVGGGARTLDTEVIAGATCSWLEVEPSSSSGSKAGGEPVAGVMCEGSSSGVVVYGGESTSDIRELAEAALNSKDNTDS